MGRCHPQCGDLGVMDNRMVGGALMEPDWPKILAEFSDSHAGKLLLWHTGYGWCYRLTSKAHNGEAKGRSPREAAKALCDKLDVKEPA